MLSILALAGCEDPGGGVIDPAGEPPYLRESRVDPDTIDLRSIPPNGELYRVSILVRAEIALPFGSAGDPAVTAALVPPQSGFPTAVATLADDGGAADSVLGDGVYSGVLTVDVRAIEAGLYRVRISAVSPDGLRSLSREQVVPITRNNARPTLSELSAPDTVDVPTADPLFITMRVRADDPDGPDDIQEVYFRSLDSSDPSRKFLLFDDGNVAGSGDRVAGDGLYSIIVQLPPGTPARTFRFAFQAEDSFRDTSDTLLHYLTVR